MKKLLSMVLMSAMIFSAVLSASALSLNESIIPELQETESGKINTETVVVEEDFSSYAPTELADTYGGALQTTLNDNSANTGITWSFTSSSTSTNTTKAGLVGENNSAEYLYFYKNRNSRTMHTMSFAEQSGTVVLSFSLYFNSASVFNIQLRSGTSYSNILNCTSDCLMYLCDGGKAKTTASGTYTLTDWTDILIEMNFDDGTYTAVIGNGSPVSGTLANSTVDGLRLDFNESSSGSAHNAGIDNIRIVKKTSETVSKYETVKTYNFDEYENYSIGNGVAGVNGVDRENSTLKMRESAKRSSALLQAKLDIFKDESYSKVENGKIAVDFDFKTNGYGGVQLVWIGSGDNSFGRYLSFLEADGGEGHGLWTKENRVTVTNSDYTSNGETWGEYEPNKWYKMHMAVDLDRQTVDVAVDGVYIIKGARAMTDSDSCQLTAVSNFWVILGNDNVADGDPDAMCWVDNFHVYKINELGTVLASEYADGQTAESAFTAQENWASANAAVITAIKGKHKEPAIALDASDAAAYLKTPSVDLTDGTYTLAFDIKKDSEAVGNVKVGETELLDESDMTESWQSMKLIVNGQTAKLFVGDIYKKDISLTAALSGELSFNAESGKIYVDNLKAEKMLDEHTEIVRTPITKEGSETEGVSAGEYQAGIAVYNYSGAAVSDIPSVIVASYNADGSLYKVGIEEFADVSVETGSTDSFTASALAPDGGSIKVFLWESAAGLKPVAGSDVLK